MESVQQDERQHELNVIVGELKSLKKTARIYKQQPNSNVYFRVSYDEALSRAQIELEKLKRTEKVTSKEVQS